MTVRPDLTYKRHPGASFSSDKVPDMYAVYEERFYLPHLYNFYRNHLRGVPDFKKKKAEIQN